jgi:hypothetical protein
MSKWLGSQNKTKLFSHSSVYSFGLRQEIEMRQPSARNAMIENHDVFSRPDELPPAPLATRLIPWLKRLLTGNPFYLASAGLLLYGMNKLSTDSRLVGAENSMLQFNFSALIAYEILLTVTAILLARRKIWYDSLLLFGLDNLFIIIPFSLVSRALFLSSSFATMMCLAGCLLAAAKFWAFKRYIPDLHLPRRLLVFGAVLLAANAFAPLHFKPLVGESLQIGYSM